MKRYIAIILALCMLVLPLTGCSKKATFTKDIYTDQRMDDDGTLLASCRYEIPVMEGGNESTREVFNSYFQKWLEGNLSWFNEVAGMAETDYNLNKDTGTEVWKDGDFWMSDEASVDFWCNDNIVTVIIDSYSFTGGIHGTYGRSAVMFNLNNGNQLTLSDMVDNFPMLNTIVCQEVTKQIEEKIAAGETNFFDDYESIVKDWDSKVCYFNEDGLVVVFCLYDIASYAAGEQRFTITYDEIKECLSNNAVKLLKLT